MKAKSQNKLTSIYKGGETAKFVRLVVAQRWGEKAAKQYNPEKNCFTYLGWKQRGFQVQKGEKSIASWTIIEKKRLDEKTGQEVVIERYKKGIRLFFKTQVKKIN